jgi:hypothetical protein
VGVLKFAQLKLSRLWGPITFRANLRLRWGLQQKCSFRLELSNDMSHATWTQGNQGDSWILMVGSQIANSILDPSFGHNLCFKCPNESCEPVLDIYVSRAFQWYKELFNPMGFDSWNFSLKIQKSTETSIPKVGAHLGVWGFIPSPSLTLPGAWNVIPGLHTWLTPLQAFVLVASPRLRMW